MGKLDELIDGVLKLLLFGSIIAAILIIIPAVFWPNVPNPSSTFDCDDGTLYMYRHFTELGLECTIMAGNLEETGESREEVNHVWLLVKCGSGWRAYDWGFPYNDRQHFEGYPIKYETLMKLTVAD